jgi:thioredoxin-like negative regulator of GroEL
MNYNKDNKLMKKLLLILLLFISYNSLSQTIITDKNFEKVIDGRSEFRDDGNSIVIVEFWADFNKDNAFKDWAKLKGVKYYRCDIAKSPNAKKDHKVRTIPHIIIFKDGYDEHHFKAGLDFSIRKSWEEIQEVINELKEKSKF